MSVFTELSRADIEALLERYTLGGYVDHQGISAGTENTNYFVDTDLGQFVLTVFEKHRPEELPFFLQLGEHLHDDQCAVPQPFRTADGDFLLTLHGKPAVMFERIQGRHQQPTPAHAQTLAEALADIHASTRRFSGTRPHSHGWDWIKETADQLAPEMSLEDQALLREALACIAGIDRSLPRGVIHADLFHDNALFDGERLAGIIDWYFAGIDLYALDIAVCMVDWCLDDQGLLDADQCAAFAEHYHQHQALKAEEINALADLTIQAATRFWLSRALAMKNNRKQNNVTIKDPEPMKNLTRHCLVQRVELSNTFKERLC